MAVPEELLTDLGPTAALPVGPPAAQEDLVTPPAVDPPADTVAPPVETFRFDRERRVLVRTVARRDGTFVDSEVATGDLDIVDHDLGAAYDRAWLRRKREPKLRGRRRTIRSVDLFSGCGGMTIGVAEACRALGMRLDPLLAVDVDDAALEAYSRNIGVRRTAADTIETILDSDWGTRLSPTEEALREELGHVDIVVGGPPCQGHSDLNNHTRRNDPKNALFAKMARFAEVCEPNHIVIENVRGVRYDNGNVFENTWRRLEALGYHVDGAMLRADTIGVPQSRPRVLLVASRLVPVDIKRMAERYRTAPRSFMWACDDLVGLRSKDPIDQSSDPKPETMRRINYLFDHDRYELPDHMRPVCHQNGHTYPSVYGRIRPHDPAPTITTGFMTMGRGRFTHPTERRTLTLHEGARIQCFPDWFRFRSLTRADCLKLIGNAVPPKMAYVFALELLR